MCLGRNGPGSLCACPAPTCYEANWHATEAEFLSVHCLRHPLYLFSFHGDGTTDLPLPILLENNVFHFVLTMGVPWLSWPEGEV